MDVPEGRATPRATTVDLARLAVEEMLEHGFEPEHPPEAHREIKQLERVAAPMMEDGRRDLRALLWSSVDNRTSRDLDQVEAAERLADGSIRLMIGIADVDAFVERGTATDQHAATNTTSVYTGVRVFHMLPTQLSTDLTSLNEGQDRHAIVMEMRIAPNGTMTPIDAYRAVVHNYAKLDYESVGAWLAGEAPPPPDLARNPALSAQLALQFECAVRLRDLRRSTGAINIESSEPQAVVVGGRVVDLTVPRRNLARELIEDFMIAANRAAAVILLERGSMSIRRVVRQPQRWDRLMQLAADLGESLPETPDSEALGAFLARRRAADPTAFADLSLTVVKLLGPGEYVLERRRGDRRDSAHFGLGVADYVHSTAPNRRFVDLVTQRLLKATEQRGEIPYDETELHDIAQRCTEREREAKKVERAMRKRIAAHFMRDRVGESFVATVTGKTSSGMWVRLLSPPVEGRLTRGGESADVGDTIRVRLARADVRRGFIDFDPETDASELPRKIERQRRKRHVADALRGRLGERFDGIVSGVSQHGVWVRLDEKLPDGTTIEGKVVAGYKALAHATGSRIAVTLVGVNTALGFIDFEYAEGVEPRKRERLERKREAARRLVARIGEAFEAEVTGVTPKAVWLRTVGEEGIEGRLVRGFRGVEKGQRISVTLLGADVDRGHIDFARD
ncbi:MAG TPA: RNB domain-containing ribonuclease [Gemmatimonadaceae bacterium]|nr:RNB domain-containing ribonuclease [Gemmatimonadaceae bacterium]